MMRTFSALQQVDPGIDPRGVVSMIVSTTGTPAADSSRHEQFYVDALARVKAIPGIADASYINHLPIAGDMWGMAFLIEGRPVPHPGDAPSATYRVVFPGYFATMRLHILRGRDVANTDRADAPRVVIINDYMAKRHWPGEDAIGKRISLGDTSWMTIVGVVKNAVRDRWGAPPEEEMYLPFFQQPTFVAGVGTTRYMTLVARIACGNSCDAAPLANQIRNAIRAVEHGAPISAVRTMSAVVDDATASTRFNMSLLGAFAGIALTLAAVGIYAVMNYSVARRTQEIGIRMALGAHPRTVLASVVGEGVKLAAAGAGTGVVIALGLTRLMRGLLYGVTPTDGLTFAGVAVLLFGVATFAAWLPARHATRIDPARALRGS
jgi:putative ABC transport system permease protein